MKNYLVMHNIVVYPQIQGVPNYLGDYPVGIYIYCFQFMCVSTEQMAIVI